MSISVLFVWIISNKSFLCLVGTLFSALFVIMKFSRNPILKGNVLFVSNDVQKKKYLSLKRIN